MPEVRGRQLIAGVATGSALVAEPISFWGGCDPLTGVIVDVHHARHGTSVAGRCLVMAHGAGSSSSASVLAEALHNGTAPAAIVLEEADGIVVLGAAVAAELYGEGCPVVVVEAATTLITDGAEVVVGPEGRVVW